MKRLQQIGIIDFNQEGRIIILKALKEANILYHHIPGHTKIELFIEIEEDVNIKEEWNGIGINVVFVVLREKNIIWLKKTKPGMVTFGFVNLVIVKKNIKNEFW